MSGADRPVSVDEANSLAEHITIEFQSISRLYGHIAARSIEARDENIFIFNFYHHSLVWYAVGFEEFNDERDIISFFKTTAILWWYIVIRAPRLLPSEFNSPRELCLLFEKKKSIFM